MGNDAAGRMNAAMDARRKRRREAETLCVTLDIMRRVSKTPFKKNIQEIKKSDPMLAYSEWQVGCAWDLDVEKKKKG